MTNLEKLRELELNMLNEFVRICNKYKLKYFLAYGTLIGAVRHKGFIPWDDDIDIWMFREDFDKFAQIAKRELDEKYFYQNYDTDTEYPYNFAKIRMNGTKFVQTSLEHLNMHHGIFIDIFPLDHARENEFRGKIDWYVNKILRTFASIVYMGNERGGRERNFVQKIIISSTKKLISRDKVHRWVDKNERKLNAKKTSRVIYRSDENWTSFSKSDFEEATAQFEGKEYMIPKGYDKILRASYGDYMKLPPEEKRISNHEVLNIDFGKYF